MKMLFYDESDRLMNLLELNRERGRRREVTKLFYKYLVSCGNDQ